MRPALEEILGGSAVEAELGDWSAFIEGIIEQFEAAIRTWRADYDALLASWHAVDEFAARPRSQANAIHYQLKMLFKTTVIETLADRQFLPHYSFPIGVHKLRVIVPDEKIPTRHREEDQYRLERAGLLAIREYVPGSQLLVGGRLVTSHGLLKHWTGADIAEMGLRGSFTKCANDHFYYDLVGSLGRCLICNGEPAKGIRHLLIPRHGFTSAAWDPPKISTDVERVGKTERATITFGRQPPDVGPEPKRVIVHRPDFGGVLGLVAHYCEDGEILVYNPGEHNRGFAICLKCGYADSEPAAGKRKAKADQERLPSGFEKHAPLTSTKWYHRCLQDQDQHLVSRELTLAARETTDVLMIDFSGVIGADGSAEVITTLGYALQIAGARLLDLDSREIGVMTAPAGEGGRGLGAVLYDNVPGGAGHVRELVERGRGWLDEARRTLYVGSEHHRLCDLACLDCILTFDAQEALDRGQLARRAALEKLDGILGLAGDRIAVVPRPDAPAEESEPQPGVPSPEERRKRASERVRRKR